MLTQGSHWPGNSQKVGELISSMEVENLVDGQGKMMYIARVA